MGNKVSNSNQGVSSNNREGSNSSLRVAFSNNLREVFNNSKEGSDSRVNPREVLLSREGLHSNQLHLCLREQFQLSHLNKHNNRFLQDQRCSLIFRLMEETPAGL